MLLEKRKHIKIQDKYNKLRIDGSNLERSMELKQKHGIKNRSMGNKREVGY